MALTHRLFGEPEEELGKALAEAFELEMLMHNNDQGYFGGKGHSLRGV